MRQRHLPHGIAKEQAHMRVPEFQERLMRGRVRDDKRHHRRKQHGTCRLRRRVRKLNKLLVAVLVPLHLFDINAVVSHDPPYVAD